MNLDYYLYIINSNGEYNEVPVKIGNRMHESIKVAKRIAREHCPDGGWCGWEIVSAWNMCLKSGRAWSDGKTVRDAMWPHVHDVKYVKIKPIQLGACKQ